MNVADKRVEIDGVDRIHGVFLHLEPIAGLRDRIGYELVIFEFERVEDWKFRFFTRLAQVGKDQSLIFVRGIRGVREIAGNPGSFGLAGRLKYCAVDSVEPAVIAAP